jgi:hypothetical protein
MWFVREVQKRLRIDPTITEWESVRTIGDVLALVERHARSTVSKRAEGDMPNAGHS